MKEYKFYVTAGQFADAIRSIPLFPEGMETGELYANIAKNERIKKLVADLPAIEKHYTRIELSCTYENDIAGLFCVANGIDKDNDDGGTICTLSDIIWTDAFTQLKAFDVDRVYPDKTCKKCGSVNYELTEEGLCSLCSMLKHMGCE